MIKKIIKSTNDTFNAIKAHVKRLKRDSEKEIEKDLSNQKTSKSTHVDDKVDSRIELTVKASTIVKVVLIMLALLLLAFVIYLIRDILLLFFVALLFAAALDPMVDALEAKRIPRALGVLIIYMAIFTVLALLMSNVVPVVASQIADLATKFKDWILKVADEGIKLPEFLSWAQPKLDEFFKGLDISKTANYKDLLINLAERLSNVAENVLNGVVTLLNGLFNTIIVLVLTFMMTIEERGIDKFILSLFPARHSEYIREKSSAIKEKMGYWLRGQVMLCLLVGFLTYIGLFIIGLITEPVQYAATISIVSGFTELIPYVGPILAWVVAVPMVANQSVFLLIWITILLYVVQALENNLLVPLVMKRAVGISPIFIMFAMFVGFALLGILGMILAVPVATAFSLFLKDYSDKDK